MLSRRVLARALCTTPASSTPRGNLPADIKGLKSRESLAQRKGELEKSSRSIPHALHERVVEWDQDLPIMPLPPLSSLIDYLVGRKCRSRDSKMKKVATRWVVQKATRLLGLEKAHQRLHDHHSRDPVNNCWYCPSNHGDTFGIRPDEVYFHEAIIPSQPVTSYAVLIRGSPRYPCSEVSDGVSMSNRNENQKVDSHMSVSDNQNVMVMRAASLVLSLLEARRFYTSENFEQERFRDKPLSMQWYKHIFSTSMQFYPGCIKRYTTPPAELPRHIVVMVTGIMYKVDVLVENEHGIEVPVGHHHLVKQFQDILEDAKYNHSNIPAGILTTLPPADRWKEEQMLKTLSPQNQSNLFLIRDSLFTVCLDPDEAPSTTNKAMYCLYSKNPANRWYDKSIQLVVLGNGVAGFVNNYLAAMTGTVATNFVGDVVRNESVFSGTHEDNTAESDEGSSYSRLTWVDNHAGYFATRTASIRTSSHTTGPFKPPSRDVFTIHLGYDFEKFCQEIKVSPGGAFQAALQLALARMRNDAVPPRVTEVASLRHLRFGGMTFMDGSLSDMRDFVQQTIKQMSADGVSFVQQTVKQMSADGVSFSDLISDPKTQEKYQHLRVLLQSATQEYKDNVVQYKKGKVYLWHLDALYRELQMPNRLPAWGARQPATGLVTNYRSTLLALLRKPLVDILPPQVPENVTSNPLWVPEIEAIGRPGVECILPTKCMALHYVFGGKAISITVNANTGHPCHEKEEQFTEYLTEALTLVKVLL